MEQTLNLTLLHRSANRAMRGKIDAAARFPPCGDNAGKLKSASYSLVRPYPRCSLAKWSSMAGQSPRVLFFAGTDTNVGKTHLAALATRELVQLGYRVGVYKPLPVVAPEPMASWSPPMQCNCGKHPVDGMNCIRFVPNVFALSWHPI